MMVQGIRRRQWLAFVPGLLVVLTGTRMLLAADGTDQLGKAVSADQPPATSPLIELEQRIARLIVELGSPQYATREKAQSELEQLGLDAFDALNEAQHHDDIEIALRARYLVRGIQVNWSREGDTKAVKQLLQDYGGKTEEERGNLMQQLAALDGRQGMEPLCRLVRYEASPRLSKRAALFVMEMEPPESTEQREFFATAIRDTVGISRRPAASWLLAYASLLAAEQSALDHCQQLVSQERQTLARSPDQTSPEINRELLRWLADRLHRHGLPQDAEESMRQMVDLVDGSRAQVLDTVDWLRTREAWGVVPFVAQRFSDTFDRDPLLLYRLAEAELELGWNERSAETAERALKAAPQEPEKHLDVAQHLQHDGLFAWAEFEYRHVIEQYADQPAHGVRARLVLAEMLHELNKNTAASELLEQLVADFESSEPVRKYVESVLGRDESGIRSRLLFFKSLHHADRDETDLQRRCLLDGYESYPLDADLLIAMFRFPDADAAWRAQTADRIEQAVAEFRRQISEYKQQATTSGSFEERARAAYMLATAYNQFAWLVANTAGDFDEALEFSQQSLELRPDAAGFLDTLGRCYFAKGDLENAILFQSKAAALEPHSPHILRQLAMFKQTQAQARQDAAKPSADGPGPP